MKLSLRPMSRTDLDTYREEGTRSYIEEPIRSVLNVFGHNPNARALYESLGYETQAVRMRKSL